MVAAFWRIVAAPLDVQDARPVSGPPQDLNRYELQLGSLIQGKEKAMPPSMGEKSVLIIDDEQGMRALIRRMLTRMGVDKVIEADSAKQALERIEFPSAAFDLVICDWNMPEMSGIELLWKVRASKPDLPFLMLTGRIEFRIQSSRPRKPG